MALPRRRERAVVCLPVLALPRRGQPLRPGQRPGPPGRRHLGRRRGHRDDARRELVGHVRHHGRHRQGRPHVGSAGGHHATGLQHAGRAGPRPVRRGERRRPARQDPRGRGPGRCREGRAHARRADRRPRCDVRRELPRQDHCRRQQQQLVLRAVEPRGVGLRHRQCPRHDDVLQPVARPRDAQRRRQRPVLISVDCHRGLAARPLDRRQEGQGRPAARPAGRHRRVLEERGG